MTCTIGYLPPVTRNLPLEDDSMRTEVERRKRIVLIVPTFPKLSETFVVSKFLGLLRAGWDVHVVCQQSDPIAWKYFPELQAEEGVRGRVHVAAPQRPAWLAALRLPGVVLGNFRQAREASGRYWRRGWRRFGPGVVKQLYLDAEIVRLQPDIVHFEFGALAVGRTYLKQLLDCKLSVSFRGYDLNTVGLEDPTYYDEVWAESDGLHLLGEDLWRRAQRRGCPPDKFHMLIPPAIDVDYFRPRGSGGVGEQRGRGAEENSQSRNLPISQSPNLSPLRILSVGRLDWKKGYEYALQAIRLLKYEGVDCEYHIIGGGELLESLAFARHELGVEAEVHFLGAQPRAVVREQMAWADVFLHAAVSEGFCNAVMEAQAMALPVVCSNAGGLPENVVDGQTGFVVPRRDPAALAEMLRLLAADAQLRDCLGRNGRQRVEECFQLPKQVAAFDRFYRAIASM